MAQCYRIPYTDRFGAHTAIKWGESPAAAAGFLSEALSGRGIGAAEIGVPELVQPQPFGDCPVPAVPAAPINLTRVRSQPANAHPSQFSLI